MSTHLELTPEWRANIAEAQTQTHASIEGDDYPRLPYGSEFPELDPADIKAQCRDCGCGLGELHVVYCCVERCPKCRSQAISCACGVGH